MKVETINSEEVPSLRMDEEEIMKRGDPVAYLKAFARISRRKDRTRIGFDRQTLRWVADMWNTAAIVAPDDDEIKHEAARYRKLASDLESGMVEYRQEGVVFLTHAQDWPRAATIHRAINAFVHAQIKVIQ